MPLIAQQPESRSVILPEGTHIARVYGLIHIGTVSTPFTDDNGEPVKLSKIRLTFEFPEEMHVFKEGDEAKPLVLSQEYTLSMGNKSNLRPIVEGIIGTGLSDSEAYNFDHEQLIGKACLVTIKHKESKKGNVYAVIASTAPLMKGQTCKPPINKPKILTYQAWDQEYFDSLPDFIKDVMKTSTEYQSLHGVSNQKIDQIPS